MVERMWVEVNGQVNYPIKDALINMMESGDFSLDDDLDKYCVSWFTINTAAAGIGLFVASWNEHPIPGEYTKVYYYNYITVLYCIARE